MISDRLPQLPAVCAYLPASSLNSAHTDSAHQDPYVPPSSALPAHGSYAASQSRPATGQPETVGDHVTDSGNRSISSTQHVTNMAVECCSCDAGSPEEQFLPSVAATDSVTSQTSPTVDGVDWEVVGYFGLLRSRDRKSLTIDDSDVIFVSDRSRHHYQHNKHSQLTQPGCRFGVEVTARPRLNFRKMQVCHQSSSCFSFLWSVILVTQLLRKHRPIINLLHIGLLVVMMISSVW